MTMAKRSSQVSALNHLAERLAERAGKGHAQQRILSEVSRISGLAKGLDEANARRSPKKTRAAHVSEIAAQARQLGGKTTAALNAAGDAYREGLAAISRRIDEKVNLKVDDKYAAEIRAAFRGTPDKDRLSLLTELVDGNRGPELAAIIRAPSILTGLNDEIRTRFEEAIVSKHAPDELAEQENLNETYEAMLAASRASDDFIRSLTDPEEIAQIEREEAASVAAHNAFEQALSEQ
jgi:hypothetical protein